MSPKRMAWWKIGLFSRATAMWIHCRVELDQAGQRRAAARSRYARDGDSEIGAGFLQGAFGHGAGDGFGNCAGVGDEVAGYAQHLFLGAV